jgi:adenylate kinase
VGRLLGIAVDRLVALTGTPGTGKSSVAASLRATVPTVELADLAQLVGAADPIPGGVAVDLAALGRIVQELPANNHPLLVAGHLAHFLPIRDVIVLRCHPLELERRLTTAHRGTRREVIENVASEALDGILLEATDLGRRVWEVDTTRKTLAAVAREVRNRIRRRGPPRVGVVDWLADPRVTEHLLRTAP